MLSFTENTQGVAGAQAPATRVAPLCVGTLFDWVPDIEELRVPPRMAALCYDCQEHAACLGRALATKSQGYWAATTTRQRGRMRKHPAQPQKHPLGDGPAEPEKHPPGHASEHQYRKYGCRCPECRAAHAAIRQRQRAAKRAADSLVTLVA